MVAQASDWVYLHAVCHPGAGTWLRLGPNGAHVLECKECRQIVTAFRVLSGEAENITHEPGLTYEEAVEPFFAPEVGVVCHNCEAVFTFSPSVQLAVEAGWLQSDSTTWACPSCRSEAILDALPPDYEPGQCRARTKEGWRCKRSAAEGHDMCRLHLRTGGGICGAAHDSDLGLQICRRAAGHKEGCDYEPI